MGMGNNNQDDKLKASSEGRTTFNEIKGMKVYDSDGEPFGHVDDVEINKSTLNPTRLIIHKGLFGEYMRINLKYIEKITSKAIYLWISPAKNLVGFKVIDIEGENVGKVTEAGKNKDGSLEYIRVETKVIRTKDKEERDLDSFAVPMLSFEDMSVTLPTTFDEEELAARIEMNKENIYIEADEVIDVGKDCVRVKKTKEEYID